ncbi:MAG: tripartite tricarboxylate transporter substrate binding protein [Betaproteobacteria bacterium]|nr:MAG: tripartite tricarboxylate transporter substrate binding protein [Betaproteobacteria bacterium]
MKSLAIIVSSMLLVGVASTLPVNAQTYPNKPVRMVVPYPAGQATDIMARAIAERLSQRLGHPVVIDNRPGAGGNIGTDAVAKAAPDGYTLLMGTNATHAMNASLYSNIPFDHIKDFSPVILVGTLPLILVAHPSIPANSVKEVIELAKAKPGALNFGIGSTSSRVSAELFKRMTNIDIVPILYKGATAMFTDLIGGQIQFGFETVATALPQVKAGKVKSVAVTSAKRTDLAPAVPTFAESGLAGYDVVGWNALFAPQGTPPEIVAKLNAEIGKILQTPEIMQRMASIGFDPAGGTAEQLAAYVRSETDKWGQTIKAAGIRVD